MNNLSNNFFYFISGILFGSIFTYLLYKNKINLLNNKITYLEEKNLNLTEHLMYLDSSPYN